LNDHEKVADVHQGSLQQKEIVHGQERSPFGPKKHGLPLGDRKAIRHQCPGAE
jgi:hypothetical protein